MSSNLTLAYWCVLIAAMLPYAATGIAKAGAFRPADNATPREWAARQTGWRARANAAQANGFEGLPFFIGAVIIAHQLGARQEVIDGLAVAYVVLRLAHLGCYLKNLATLRSLVWGLGLLANIALLFAGR